MKAYEDKAAVDSGDDKRSSGRVRVVTIEKPLISAHVISDTHSLNASPKVAGKPAASTKGSTGQLQATAAMSNLEGSPVRWQSQSTGRPVLGDSIRLFESTQGVGVDGTSNTPLRPPARQEQTGSSNRSSALEGRAATGNLKNLKSLFEGNGNNLSNTVTRDLQGLAKSISSE